MESAVLSVLNKHCPPGATLAVGLSGGEDSMCLISVLLRVWDKSRIKAVHVQHGIRGRSALSDAEFTEKFCRENGITLYRFDADIPSVAKRSGLSVESAARQYRKEVFERILSEKKADFIVLAHHLLDQAESVYMHVFRGSGAGGLKGMSECDGKYLRPLIAVEKSEINEYVRLSEIAYCTDETNSDTAYNRNFIRNKVIPLVSARYDAVSAAIRLAALAKADDDFIYSLVDNNDFVTGENRCTFSVKNLIKPYALASRYALTAMKKAGLTVDVEKKHVDGVISLAEMQNGKKIALPHGYEAAKEYDRIAVYEKHLPERDCAPYAEGITPYSAGVVYVLPAEKKFAAGVTVFDGDKIPPSAVIRFRREGDVFKPFGGGTKKLKEYLIDRKIPSRTRDRLALIAVDNRVLVIAGVQISDDVKITNETKNIMKFIYEE